MYWLKSPEAITRSHCFMILEFVDQQLGCMVPIPFLFNGAHNMTPITSPEADLPHTVATCEPQALDGCAVMLGAAMTRRGEAVAEPKRDAVNNRDQPRA